jgi:hypothetical protein
MQIDESDEHLTNASNKIPDSFESRSNVTVERQTQFAKQRCQSRVTEFGIQTDKSDAQSANTSLPMDASEDPDSNVTIESNRH